MNLQEALNALGNTTENIALTLQSMHIQGKRNNPLTCPVSLYLLLHGIRNPSVSMSNIVYDADQDRRIIPTPDAVSEFVRLFDTGSYPQLVRY